jgi:hypothetical protein
MTGPGLTLSGVGLFLWKKLEEITCIRIRSEAYSAHDEQ